MNYVCFISLGTKKKNEGKPNSRVLVHLDRLLPDGLDEVEVDEEYELEAGDLQDGVVAKARAVAAGNLKGKRKIP